MCGIVGYVGQKSVVPVIIEGLRKLEYRGYDSAGVAVVHDGCVDLRRSAGKLSNLETVIGAAPLLPSSSPLQNSSTLFPIGVSTPRPVTTTRRRSGDSCVLML